MVHEAMEKVDAVRLPPLSVNDGDWMNELDLPTLLNAVLLNLPLAVGRRLSKCRSSCLLVLLWDRCCTAVVLIAIVCGVCVMFFTFNLYCLCAEHLVRLNLEHYTFRFESRGEDVFCVHLNLQFPVGKGALQSQQGVPLRSKVYSFTVSIVKL